MSWGSDNCTYLLAPQQTWKRPKKTYLTNPRRLMLAANVWMPSASSNIGIQMSSADVQTLACSNIGIQNYTRAYSTSYRLPMFECLLMFEWMFPTSAFKSWMPTIKFTPMFETFIHTSKCIQMLAADIWTGVADEFVRLYAPHELYS